MVHRALQGPARWTIPAHSRVLVKEVSVSLHLKVNLASQKILAVPGQKFSGLCSVFDHSSHKCPWWRTWSPHPPSRSTAQSTLPSSRAVISRPRHLTWGSGAHYLPAVFNQLLLKDLNLLQVPHIRLRSPTRPLSARLHPIQVSLHALEVLEDVPLSFSMVSTPGLHNAVQ